MKKGIFSLIFLAGFFVTAVASDTTLLYNPKANASVDIATAVALAKNGNKHVLIQAGGNWCVWCLRFNQFSTSDSQIDSLTKANYVVYHLNYSTENKNEATFAKLGYPQRFGFPVFIVLDQKGSVIHIQNSAYLELGKSYDKEKVMEFLKQWSVAALDPKNY